MKKALVLLLVLAMLAPMCLTQPAKAATPDKPFYVMSWSDFDEKTYPNIDGLYQLNWGNMGGDIQLGSVRYNSPDMVAKAKSLAQTIKNDMLARPAGARYIHTFQPQAQYRLAPEDALFFDFAVDQMVVVMDTILKEMKAIECPLDGIVVDLEYVGLSTYYLVDTDGGKYQDNSLQANPNLLRDIVKNPKYKTQIRPLLEEWGFIFYDAGDPAKQASFTELYSITKAAGSKYEKSRSVWNTVTRIHLNNTVTKWAYEPLMKYYPECNVSDYQSTDTATWLKMTATTDDGTEMNGGNSIKAGDTSTYSFYYGSPGNELKHFTGANDAIFAAGPYKTFMYEVNNAKYFYEATNTKKFAPWITSYYYGGAKTNSPACTPLYTELLYHLAMLDPKPFLSYTYTSEYSKENWINTQRIMSEIMKAVSDVAGYSDRKPIQTPIDWNSKYVLSGMYTGGRNLWRITPDTRVISLTEFKKDAADPTFSVNGKTITFPGGKILPEAAITFGAENKEEVGSCGYWIETPKDVVPVVTTEADRYEFYPSLVYDFENYNSGAFDYNTAAPKDAWAFTWSPAGNVKGESYIINRDANNKLAIVGNSKNYIKDLPTNITAGDSFAKDQVWQLTVTLPKELSESTQIDILNYTGNKQQIADGGFMIKGNKLYYSIGKADAEGKPIYEELMEVEADTSYTFKRIMNFHHENSYYCSYEVATGNGRVLKSVEEVKCPSFNYITQIGFGVTGATNPIIVDDFKIYLTGVAADFSIYDAKTGLDAEIGALRDRSTAYRLSWLNACGEDHTATIKADVTTGGKTETITLKEVKLVAGDDGIVTGIVNIEKGQTVKVYMETSVQTPVNPFAVPEEAGPLVDSKFTEGGIEKVTEELKAVGFDTVDKIKEALESKLEEAAKDTPGDKEFIHYTLEIDKDQLPKHGKVTVIMPYPDGTDANYTFFAAQMFITDDYGKKIGDIEILKVVNTPDGIQFEVLGASPVSIAWVAPDEVTSGRIPKPPTESRNAPTAVWVERPGEETDETEYIEETEYVEETEEPEAPTEAVETTAPATTEEGGVNIVLIIVIAVVVLAGAGAAVFFLLKKKKAAVKTPEDIEEIEEIEEGEQTEATEENAEEKTEE